MILLEFELADTMDSVLSRITNYKKHIGVHILSLPTSVNFVKNTGEKHFLVTNSSANTGLIRLSINQPRSMRI